MKAGWEVKPIKDVTFIQEGPGIRKYEYEEGGYPMINVRCVQDGYIDMSNSKAAIPEIAEGKWKHFQIEEGDILFTISGTIGRTAIVQREDLPLLMNTSVVRFRPTDPALNRDYLYLFLQSDGFQKPLEELTSGAAIRNVGPTHIKTMHIPIPPLEEQKRIVAVLDAAFEGLTRAKENAEANLQNARELFERSTDALLLKMLSETPLIPLSEVANLDRGHNPPKSDFVYEPREGYVRFYQIRDRKSDEYSVYVPETKKLHRVEPHEILMTAYRHIGEVFRGASGAFNVALCKLSSKSEERLLHDFLFAMIPTHFVKGELLKYSERSLIPSMSVKHLETITIPVPDLETQSSVVLELQRLSSEALMLEEAYRTKLTDISDLRQSLLQKAFAGELT